MNAKFGADVTELSCKRVQVGTETLADGSVQPIFQVEPHAPRAYRQLIEVVANQVLASDAEYVTY